MAISRSDVVFVFPDMIGNGSRYCVEVSDTLEMIFTILANLYATSGVRITASKIRERSCPQCLYDLSLLITTTLRSSCTSENPGLGVLSFARASPIVIAAIMAIG